MRGRLGAVALVAACSIALAGAQAQAAQPRLQLDFYSAQVTAEQYSKLLAKGYDVTAAHDVAGGKQVDLVLSPQQLKKLRRQGIKPELKLNDFGRSASQEAAQQAAAGYTVWRDYDSADGIAAQLQQIARDHPEIATLETIGTTGQGRPDLRAEAHEGRRRPQRAGRAVQRDAARARVDRAGDRHADPAAGTSTLRREGQGRPQAAPERRSSGSSR